jgi:Primase C terminal 2 (PriCT-2)
MLNPNPNENIASDINSRKLVLTLLKDKTGSDIRQHEFTLPEWGNHILKADSGTKETLRWLKGAIFGSVRSKNGSYRTNANAKMITAAVVEYDKPPKGVEKAITFDEAVAIIRKAGLRALLYTSPSHKEGSKPRWRGIFPLSEHRDNPKATHEDLVAKINGLFGGQIAPESFTLSQSYYAGSVGNNPDHRVEIIDGDFLDLRDDLIAGRIYRSGSSERDTDEHEPSEPTAPIEKVIHALSIIPNDENLEWPEWNTIGMATWISTGGSDDGYKAFDAFSKKNTNEKYDEDDVKDRWYKAYPGTPPGNLTFGKLWWLAQDESPGCWSVWEEEQEQQAQKAFKQQQQTAYGQSSDTRPQLPLPAKDAPWLPVMNKIDEVLGASTDIKPPCRDIDGFMVAARKVVVPKTHAYQNETDETTEKLLPPPEQWMLSRLSENELAESIEQHIKFHNFKKQPVHLQNPFVKHYHQRKDSPLPIAVTIVLSPIVQADGNILAGKGLDRVSGTIFEIPQQLLDNLPRREDCTPAAVTAAMKFLCDEWLCDVSTDLTGKATIIAAALTIIERTLLPNRPAFVLTAGRRGGGKSTVIEMLIMAVTGILPAASAWSDNEEERRKTLMAQFISGVSYILWDNIKRGAQIACPHIERAKPEPG